MWIFQYAIPQYLVLIIIGKIRSYRREVPFSNIIYTKQISLPLKLKCIPPTLQHKDLYYYYKLAKLGQYADNKHCVLSSPVRWEICSSLIFDRSFIYCIYDHRSLQDIFFIQKMTFNSMLFQYQPSDTLKIAKVWFCFWTFYTITWLSCIPLSSSSTSITVEIVHSIPVTSFFPICYHSTPYCIASFYNPSRLPSSRPSTALDRIPI